MNQGVTLAEVLVSLLLITGVLLAVLKQEYQARQAMNQVHLRAFALIYLDNASERLSIGKPLLTPPKPFYLKKTDSPLVYSMELTWMPIASPSGRFSQLKRHVCL